MVIQIEAVSFLFLNPPYDFALKGMDDSSAKRKEWVELERNYRYLKENGILIYIIPSYRFAIKKFLGF